MLLIEVDGFGRVVLTLDTRSVINEKVKDLTRRDFVPSRLGRTDNTLPPMSFLVLSVVDMTNQFPEE